MQMHTVLRGQTFNPVDASRTLTITNDPTQEGDEAALNPEGGDVIGALILRGGDRRTQRVAWGEDVVDNEGCGKKKSKICCIYHKPRRFDESSSEESSDSDSEPECHHDHDHLSHPNANGGPSSNGQQMGDGSSVIVHHEGHPEPNAYEKQPHPKKGKRKHT